MNEPTVASKVKEIAQAKKIPLYQLGRESGVGENAIYRWDKQTPTISTLKKVAKYLDVDYKILLP